MKGITKGFHMKINKDLEFLGIDKWGIWFWYKGDHICRIWPWGPDRKYSKSRKYYSVSFETFFETLEDMDKFWEGYSKS